MSGQLEDFDNISHYLLYRYRTLAQFLPTPVKKIYWSTQIFFFHPIKKITYYLDNAPK